ncbi:endopeptidase La [Mycoplasmopsis alligatoris]|uniref:Lon protease n=1 Tax=Mycoplasmopsis alligatoris A21JP2 TaxID=747682 RepID=D4XWZ8_9BACT|nr:endopeptidase La [Mycoplasmopsis alligatoris]EFF41147.1 endopeptidase La [Mycoplasmopsis alligatoris A21JP2]
MLLPYIIIDKKDISFPHTVYVAKVDEKQQEKIIIDYLLKGKFERVAIFYNDTNSKTNSIIPVALYAKPLKFEKIKSEYFLTFKGIERLKLTGDSLNFDENNFTKSEKQTAEEFENVYKNFVRADKLHKSFDSIIEEIKETQETISSIPNLLYETYSNLEKMNESLLKLNPYTGKKYKLSDVMKLQNIDRENNQDAIENPNVLLSTLLSFTTDLEIYYSSLNLFCVVNPLDYFNSFSNIITYAAGLIELETDIQGTINDNMMVQQKEFLLREKMKVIKSELRSLDVEEEHDEYSKIIKNKKLKFIYPETVQKIIREENEKHSQMISSSPDANITRTYIDTLKKLPWRKTAKEHLDIKKAREILDKYHYGLDEVKERIIEHLAVILNNRNHSKSNKNIVEIDKEHEIDLNLFKNSKLKESDSVFNNVPILALVGPPGTGKTSLSKAIAEALQKSFVKISLGGVHDESEIRGHRRTYVGAMPGKIIKAILKAEVSNPLVLLDEIDKMASDMKGDPASAMLEVLDPEQNTKFQDHYLEHEYDLSKIMFLATANYYEDIPAPLIDRIEIIELSPYTITEKVKIARNHLLKKVREQTSLSDKLFQISDETIIYIIKHYTHEAGVRGLKRILDKIARKIVVKVIDNPKMKSFEVKKEMLIDLIGIVKFREEELETEEVKGTATGLAYTSTGGSTLQIEVTAYPGKGEIKLTGQLKDIMQESAQIALTYVRANAEKFNIKDFDFENNIIHIHVPEGAVPKDGPSAGVTFTTAIISALSGKTVKNVYGMTGEITLRGKVLEIGGLKEKSFAASQLGLKYVFIPYNNIKNLRDIPDEIKDLITYLPVKKYDEIFDILFLNKEHNLTIDKTNNKDLSKY